MSHTEHGVIRLTLLLAAAISTASANSETDVQQHAGPYGQVFRSGEQFTRRTNITNGQAFVRELRLKLRARGLDEARYNLLAERLGVLALVIDGQYEGEFEIGEHGDMLNNMVDDGMPADILDD